MESPEAVSSGFLPLPPEPPDPDLDVMLLVDHPVPPVPPHPPPILIDASVLSVQPLLMHPLLAEADLSSSLTTRRVPLSLGTLSLSSFRYHVVIIYAQPCV
ncbi:BnaC09g52230D [Brassica napus]|uniref:BnaC09g52230D protein n=1 Tax=Brassica napus TaxID=3708 RepID=A0A078IKJ5_BRANA|nr:BnaC09g52230D [Brassica napus]